jgi:hypothetical protein
MKLACIPRKTGLNPGAMIPPDPREVVFAGAGILWGATTFVRGWSLWRSIPRKTFHRKTPIPMSLLVGFALTLGCSAYLAMSIRDSFK